MSRADSDRVAILGPPDNLSDFESATDADSVFSSDLVTPELRVFETFREAFESAYAHHRRRIITVHCERYLSPDHPDDFPPPAIPVAFTLDYAFNSNIALTEALVLDQYAAPCFFHDDLDPARAYDEQVANFTVADLQPEHLTSTLYNRAIMNLVRFCHQRFSEQEDVVLLSIDAVNQANTPIGKAYLLDIEIQYQAGVGDVDIMRCAVGYESVYKAKIYSPTTILFKEALDDALAFEMKRTLTAIDEEMSVELYDTAEAGWRRYQFCKIVSPEQAMVLMPVNDHTAACVKEQPWHDLIPTGSPVTAMVLDSDLRHGRRTLRALESIGFTPERFESIYQAVKSIKRSLHPIEPFVERLALLSQRMNEFVSDLKVRVEGTDDGGELSEVQYAGVNSLLQALALFQARLDEFARLAGRFAADKRLCLQAFHEPDFYERYYHLLADYLRIADAFKACLQEIQPILNNAASQLFPLRVEIHTLRSVLNRRDMEKVLRSPTLTTHFDAHDYDTTELLNYEDILADIADPQALSCTPFTVSFIEADLDPHAEEVIGRFAHRSEYPDLQFGDEAAHQISNRLEHHGCPPGLFICTGAPSEAQQLMMMQNMPFLACLETNEGSLRLLTSILPELRARWYSANQAREEVADDDGYDYAVPGTSVGGP